MPDVIRVPLKEAVIEVRFPGDARVDSWRGEFQQKVRGRLPHLLVPAFQPGQFVALAHYRFANANQTETVSLAINSLAYTVKEYPGWADFRREFLQHWMILEAAIKPETLTRVGVRYINTFEGEELLSKLANEPPHKYLVPLTLSPDVYQALIRFNMDVHKMQVNVSRPEGTQDLTIDLDSFAINVSPGDLETTLERLHENVESEFFASLKHEFVETLKNVG